MAPGSTPPPRPPPRGWVLTSVEREGQPQDVYVSPKYLVAQWTNPAIEDTPPVKVFPEVVAKLNQKKSALLYCFLSPQPKKILPGYVSDNGLMQPSDPTPTEPETAADALPAGWTEQQDGDGDAFWVNRNSMVATYDDPRVVPHPEPSRILSIEDSGSSALRLRKSTSSQSSIKRKPSKRKSAKWKVGPRSGDGFDMLDFCLVPQHEIPAAARNKKVNRYLDILPTAATAVTLPSKPELGPESEYINANFITGPKGEPKKFIAAMGPKSETVHQFWRMIWQEHVEGIVMLTNIMERGRSKCAEYFPTSARTQDFHIGDFQVSLMGQEPSHDYVVSLYSVTLGDEQRDVVHFWYHTWPDHDVPRSGPNMGTYTAGLLQLIDQVNSRCKSGRPIVVHCSAGVGRTGTYIAVHYARERLVQTGFADPIKIINELRLQRPAMVQHLSQFLFVHDCVTDHIENLGKEYVVVEPDILDSHEEESETQEKFLAADAEARQKMRQEEKQAALVRKEAILNAQKMGSMRKVRKPESHAHGEMSLPPINYDGKLYHFNDVNGDGIMDWKEAAQDGYPRELFNRISGGAESVTVASFMQFRSLHFKRSRQAVASERPAMSHHPEMAFPWYAGEITMSAALEWMKGTPRGAFLIRRSTTDPNKFHLLVSIVRKDARSGVGKYELNLRDGIYYLHDLEYKSLKSLVASAKTKLVLRDAEGGLKLSKPIFVQARGTRP